MTQPQLDTVRTYLRHLHDSDTAGLIATFEDDGLVHSPFLGTMKAVQPADNTVRVAAYFRYDWTLNDGRLLDFTCVDVFGFKPGSDRIASMHIVYDTHPLRERVGDKYAPDPLRSA